MPNVLEALSCSPQIIGHRGAPSLAPENTLESFAAALDAGATGIELDVQLSKDGVLIVHHDPDIEGVALRNLTAAEIRTRTPHIPILEDTFALLERYPGKLLNIELKTTSRRSDGREAALAEALRNWTGHNQTPTWISTFDPYALIRLARFDIAPLAFLISVEEAFELLPALPTRIAHAHYNFLTEERIAQLKDGHYLTFAWTVNDEVIASKLWTRGVNGLIGDDPRILKRTKE